MTTKHKPSEDDVIVIDPYKGLNITSSASKDDEDDGNTVLGQVYTHQKVERPSTLDEAMLQMEQIQQVVNNRREMVCAKLAACIDNMDFSNLDSEPESLEAKARVISEFKGVLNDIESSMKSKVAAKTKLHSIQAQANNVTVAAATILSQISANINLNKAPRTAADLDSIDKELDQRSSDEKLVVLDTELEVGGHMLPKKAERDDFN